MHRRSLIVIAIISLGVLGGSVAVATSRDSAPDHGSSPESRSSKGSVPANATGALTLVSTKLSVPPAQVTVGPGRTALETRALTVSCPGPNPCTIEAEQNAQVEGSTDNNRWSICTHVDGEPMAAPLCPYYGSMPNGSSGVGSFSQSQWSVPPGTHKVRSFIYTDDGGTLLRYEIAYRVYSE